MEIKLPYYKTTIRDKSQYIDIGSPDSGINIASIINSKTGPLERVSLTSFDDLVSYYCTGSKLSQTDNETIQVLGAMLNVAPVDVIRVGTAKLRLGKTDDEKLVYTDSNYKLLDNVTIADFIDIAPKTTSYVTKIDTVSYDGQSIEDLAKEVFTKLTGKISYTNTSVTYSEPLEFYDTTTVDSRTSYLSCNYKLSGTETEVASNTYLEINNKQFYLKDTTSNIQTDLSNSIGIPAIYSRQDKFLTNVALALNSNELAAYAFEYDMSSVAENCSESLKQYIVNNTYSYSPDHVFNEGFWIRDGATVYSYKSIEGLDEDATIVDVYTGTNNYTDFIRILREIELKANKSIVYMNRSELYVSATIANDVDFKVSDIEGIYRTEFIPMDSLPYNYSVCIDGIVYHAGQEPTLYNESAIEYVSLSKTDLIYDDFIEKLISALQANMTIGLRSKTKVIFANKPEILFDTNLLKVHKAIINTEVQTRNSRFALIAKFPTVQNLFSFAYQKSADIDDYNTFDISWSYNQKAGSMSISFDENAVDGYGTSLYYTRFNEGDTQNDYFHLLKLSDDIQLTDADSEQVNVSPFGIELILPEPSETDYADALAKFTNYEDKNYSFIWDSGHSSPILAKAMNSLAIEKNAQFVPSYPAKANTVEEIIAYDKSLGLDTPYAIKVVPGHKGTYCGNFLTTVPGSFAYIAARVNSYKNGANEFQPLFGSTRGAVSAPNLVWNINKEDRQKLINNRINAIVNDINGTYLNFNLTSQKVTSYLSQDQNMYMSNVIAHVCQEYNPKIISEMNTPELWATIVSQLTKLISERFAGKNPSFHAFRVICNEKLNTQDVIESKRVKYKVEVQYNIATAYVDAYVDVVRLNSW